MHSQQIAAYETRYLIPTPNGHIELILALPKEQPTCFAIVCHPDPQQEGSMFNKVVTTMTKTFYSHNIAAIRFNFRGVGKSSGTYGNKEGEIEDLKIVIDWGQSTLGKVPFWLAGFSFGSYISAACADQKDVLGLISIAPSVQKYNFAKIQNGITCPWWVIHGTQDEVAPFEDTKTWAANNQHITFIPVDNSGHFFHGKLVQVQDLLSDIIKTTT